jgi:UDP-N-acetylmuramoyl-L-alanyl-D-glutamate--2,6-diaminopimelate ligase
VAAAAACALGVGLPPEAIPVGVLAAQRIPGRMERVDRGQPFTVLVDYAHTEEALRGALRSVREFAPRSIHLLFGCGGERDRGKRRTMGRVAAELADRLVLTSDNPRKEDPNEILAEIAGGVEEVEGAAERTRIVPDRYEAIHSVLSAAGSGDVVILAGKGHETTQTFLDHVEPFDDRRAAERALDELGWHGRRHA